MSNVNMEIGKTMDELKFETPAAPNLGTWFALHMDNPIGLACFLWRIGVRD